MQVVQRVRVAAAVEHELLYGLVGQHVRVQRLREGSGAERANVKEIDDAVLAADLQHAHAAAAAQVHALQVQRQPRLRRKQRAHALALSQRVHEHDRGRLPRRRAARAHTQPGETLVQTAVVHRARGRSVVCRRVRDVTATTPDVELATNFGFESAAPVQLH